MTTNFTNSENDIPLMVFQGAQELPIDAALVDSFKSVLDRWCDRSDLTKPDLECFFEDGVLAFAISYQGETLAYWPDQIGNAVGETLVRSFLYHEGVCRVNSEEVRLYRTHYKLEAFDEHEYLLICPYPTEAGNIGGLVVVCVNHRLKAH